MGFHVQTKLVFGWLLIAICSFQVNLNHLDKTAEAFHHHSHGEAPFFVHWLFFINMINADWSKQLHCPN